MTSSHGLVRVQVLEPGPKDSQLNISPTSLKKVFHDQPMVPPLGHFHKEKYYVMGCILLMGCVDLDY